MRFPGTREVPSAETGKPPGDRTGEERMFLKFRGERPPGRLVPQGNSSLGRSCLLTEVSC